MVRSWGFIVPNRPVPAYGRKIDIYGGHIPIYDLSSGEKMTFLGECKRYQNKVGANVVDEFTGILWEVKNRPHTITAILSHSGFTDQAIDRAKER